MGGNETEKKKEGRRRRRDLKIAGTPPIEDLPEEVAELTESEEETVAKIGGESGQIRDGDHLDLPLLKTLPFKEINGRAKGPANHPNVPSD